MKPPERLQTCWLVPPHQYRRYTSITKRQETEKGRGSDDRVCANRRWKLKTNQSQRYVDRHQRCKGASTQPRNGAVSQLGVSEHLTDTLTRIECSSCRGWDRLLLLGVSSQGNGSVNGVL
ncbi:hypothetical protein llap_17745 [Limosa lapponica baueri]|uniref:Uncharacterized protein n=1 Tax=Limosa lapponica baueri TaxID=1758121 RepID=A0A2I0TDS9_LIMLA|nr:hypothetical protein llap_17745 [Limosa lapponica baueri]